MKLEPVLPIKIVDNFVRFGMPYTRKAVWFQDRAEGQVASFPGQT